MMLAVISAIGLNMNYRMNRNRRTMKQIDPTSKINVEALKQVLLHGRITKARFDCPLTYEQTVDALQAAVRAEVEYRHLPFKDSHMLGEYIEQAARWLKEQKKFGLLLCGMPGNGKTTLMKAICSLIGWLETENDYNERRYVRQIDSREIARLAKDAYDSFVKVRNFDMLAIDDLGLEPAEVLDYGNILNPVVDLISYRYNEQLFTIVTTNLKPEQIREKYGDRIADRFNEMMSKIIFKNDSYRGK